MGYFSIKSNVDYDGIVNEVKYYNTNMQLQKLYQSYSGALSADKMAVPTVNHSESWNFDKTGNWSQYTCNGSIETRTHNAANELQGIATHDANGNMTLMPCLKGKYDAWNRLVEVKDSSDNVIATYEYNGLNQRIKKTVGGVLTKSFYNENWQEVESVTGSQMTSYVWGLRYVDDLVLREKGEERLYSLADPNWNVVALVDASGAVVERMKYDAFGKITWLDAGFGVKTVSDYNWNRTFTGQVLDSETGLMLYRNRYFNVLLGRWVNRDPIGYEAGDVNVYRYVHNSSQNKVDPDGHQDYGALGAFGVNPYDMAGNGARAASQNPRPASKVEKCCRNTRVCMCIDAISYCFGIQHCWLRTASRSGGMGPAGGGRLPMSPWYGTATEVRDHSKEDTTDCTPIGQCDENCVNYYITPGRSTGKWSCKNNCNTFVDDVIATCCGKNK